MLHNMPVAFPRHIVADAELLGAAETAQNRSILGGNFQEIRPRVITDLQRFPARRFWAASRELVKVAKIPPAESTPSSFCQRQDKREPISSV